MLMLFIGAIISAALGVMIRFFKWYLLIAGYNTMTKERRRKVDIEGLGKFVGNCFFLIAGIMAAGSVMTYFQIPGVSSAVPVAVAVLVIYLLIKAQQFDSGTRNPDGTMNKSTKTILIVIIISISVIGLYIYSSTSASEVVVNADSVQIKGQYGVEIMMDDINDITLEETMPTVLRKTNGFSAGGTLKGHFKLENIDRARLYINANNPPFIFIDTVDGLVIVNQDNRQSTEELYQLLMSSF